ncbi:MAG: hypothetical protein FWF92_05800 [Oscillospiraceae bacterium]|nr:hypothetical protein [Oscillospiraceae bacterium]
MKTKLKQIFIIIFLVALVLSSCAVNDDVLDNHEIHATENIQESEDIQTENNTTESQTESAKPINYNINFSEDFIEFKQDLSDGEKTENVLIWSDFDYNFDKPREEKEPFIVKFEDKNQEISFINKYLQEREMLKETPDSIFYGGECYIVEYYVNSDKRQTSFIIYFNEKLDSCHSYGGQVCCMTIPWDDLQEFGSIAYNCNQNGDAVYEDFYNTDGEHITNLSYEYFDGVPFPFIKENAFYKSFELTDRDIDMYSYLRKSVLNRNQKFWFYKDFYEFDATGKVSGIKDDTEFYNRFNEFLYDENGRLKEIREHFSEEEKITMPDFIELDFSVDFSGTITLDYRENNKLKSADYGYFYYNHGTYDCSGDIQYDEQGRMLYRHYYITHGCHTHIYLYEGNSKRPWAYIQLCEGCNPFVLYLFPNKI